MTAKLVRSGVEDLFVKEGVEENGPFENLSDYTPRPRPGGIASLSGWILARSGGEGGRGEARFMAFLSMSRPLSMAFDSPDCLLPESECCRLVAMVCRCLIKGLIVSSQRRRCHDLATKASRLATLLEMTSQLGQAFQVDALLQRVVEQLLQIFKQADCGMMIVEVEETGELAPRVVRLRKGGDPSTVRFSRSASSASALESGHAILSKDIITKEPGFDPHREPGRRAYPLGYVRAAFGSRTSGRPFGVIPVGHPGPTQEVL